MIDIFNQILLFLYHTTGNLGLAIIVLTILIRALLLPLVLPSLKARKKITELQPELKKLKAKHGKDKQAFQKAQLELYQKYNVNPLSGCLPQIIQLGLLIFLYRALITFLGVDQLNGTAVDPNFLWLNLGNPDNKYVLPVLAAVSQLVLSVMVAPGGETPDLIPNQSKSKAVQKANEKEEDVADMASSMQKQMLFVMPFMTGFIATRFPSGLALYWVMTTVFSIGQQYFISGWGGLTTYYQRVRNWLFRSQAGPTVEQANKASEPKAQPTAKSPSKNKELSPLAASLKKAKKTKTSSKKRKNVQRAKSKSKKRKTQHTPGKKKK